MITLTRSALPTGLTRQPVARWPADAGLAAWLQTARLDAVV